MSRPRPKFEPRGAGGESGAPPILPSVTIPTRAGADPAEAGAAAARPWEWASQALERDWRQGQAPLPRLEGHFPEGTPGGARPH